MATILIVEDHAMSRQMLASLLSYAGHHVLEAVEGTGALTLAYNERPDLIIRKVSVWTKHMEPAVLFQSLPIRSLF